MEGKCSPSMGEALSPGLQQIILKRWGTTPAAAVRALTSSASHSCSVLHAAGLQSLSTKHNSGLDGPSVSCISKLRYSEDSVGLFFIFVCSSLCNNLTSREISAQFRLTRAPGFTDHQCCAKPLLPLSRGKSVDSCRGRVPCGTSPRGGVQ